MAFTEKYLSYKRTKQGIGVRLRVGNEVKNLIVGGVPL